MQVAAKPWRGMRIERRGKENAGESASRVDLEGDLDNANVFYE